MCDSIYCAYILVILCIVLYMFFYEANKDDYYWDLTATKVIKIRPYLDKVTLRNLYLNACDTHLDPIIKIQKKCVRVITFSHYLEPTESLFKDLKILAFKKLVIQRILLLMFKHNIGIVRKPIASLFTKKSEIHNYNTRHCSSLHPAIGKSEATYRTFSYHAILIWNYLSKLICTNVTLACFKKGL